jgi:hypothetical protein
MISRTTTTSWLPRATRPAGMRTPPRLHGPVHPCGRRQPAARRRRHVLHPRRTPLRGAPEGSGR